MHQVAQSVERRTLEVEIRGSKPALGTWWWGRISPNQPYPKGEHTSQRVVIPNFPEWEKYSKRKKKNNTWTTK